MNIEIKYNKVYNNVENESIKTKQVSKEMSKKKWVKDKETCLWMIEKEWIIRNELMNSSTSWVINVWMNEKVNDYNLKE